MRKKAASNRCLFCYAYALGVPAGDAGTRIEGRSMSTPFSGGCACGAIRYECGTAPIAMFKCHCRDCQHVTGGAFSAVVYVPLASFKLTRGSLRYHDTPSLSGGHNKRGFCPDCGSRISGGENSVGIGITAGSLDDPSWFRSQMDIFVSDAQPWDILDTRTPKFEHYPSPA
jgi:hypothetical protein